MTAWVDRLATKQRAWARMLEVLCPEALLLQKALEEGER